MKQYLPAYSISSAIVSTVQIDARVSTAGVKHDLEFRRLFSISDCSKSVIFLDTYCTDNERPTWFNMRLSNSDARDAIHATRLYSFVGKSGKVVRFGGERHDSLFRI